MSRPPASSQQDRQARLDELEAVVRRGFYEAGKALVEIRDGKLWALRCKTWEHYCRSRLESTKTTINRLIDATKTADEALRIAAQSAKMTPIGVTDLVQNEHQARLLKPHLPELNERVVVKEEDPQKATKAILERAKHEEVIAKQKKTEQRLQRQQQPAQTTPPPLPPAQRRGRASPVIDQRPQIEAALTNLLTLLDDESNGPAFDHCTDLAEQVWRRLKPIWFTKGSVSPSSEKGTETRRKP